MYPLSNWRQKNLILSSVPQYPSFANIFDSQVLARGQSSHIDLLLASCTFNNGFKTGKLETSFETQCIVSVVF